MKRMSGFDAQIELCHRPEVPSGFVVGVQVKAGESYVRNETESTFTFYPSIEDLQYWRSYALPIYLVVYHPARDVAYWLNIKKSCDDKRFADIRAGISPCKLVFQKSDTFAGTFFRRVIPADDLDQQRLYHTLLATAFEDDIDVSTPMLPARIYHRIRQLDAPTAANMLRFVDTKFAECVEKMMVSEQREESLVEEYIREVAHKLRERSFTAEGTGFVFMAFDDAGVRDKAGDGIEAIMPTNRYLVLKARRCMGPVLMDHMLLVAFDDWDTNEERFGTAWTPLKRSLGVALGGTYDLEFYGPKAAATFLTPDYAFQYEFETFLDTGRTGALRPLPPACARTEAGYRKRAPLDHRRAGSRQSILHVGAGRLLVSARHSSSQDGRAMDRDVRLRAPHGVRGRRRRRARRVHPQSQSSNLPRRTPIHE